MDTYNENLQSTVDKTMELIEKEMLKDASALNASEFTLYHAQGARITAENKLNEIKTKYDADSTVDQLGVDVENVAVNTEASANAAKTQLAVAVSDTATAATNAETAANAVSLVAADMGAVFNLVSAEDFGTDIYTWSKYANALINDTAYNCEQASQFAMEASYQTAEVTSPTVADKAKALLAAVEELNKATTGEFDKVSAAREAAANDVAVKSKAEKKAEGELLDNYVENTAVKESYIQANEELNFNLTVDMIEGEDTAFDVTFDGMTTPFLGAELFGIDLNVDTNATILTDPRVEDYYVMVVAQDKANLFLVAQAEALLDDPMKARKISATDGATGAGYHTKISNDQSNPAYLQDVDGHDIAMGKNYVVFVLAAFETKYKKLVNNYTDFLSVASYPFALTYKLEAVNGASILITQEGTATSGGKISFNMPNRYLHFSEFRLMFLQQDPNITSGLMTYKKMEAIGDEVQFNIDQEVLEMEAEVEHTLLQIEANDVEIAGLTKRLQDVKKMIADHDVGNIQLEQEEIDRLNNEALSIPDKIKLLKKIVKGLHEALKALQEQLQTLIDQAAPKPGFFWNLSIAEEVTAANYITVSSDGDTGSETVTVDFELDTTDNFGAPIIPGEDYIPVILTWPSVHEDLMAEYSTAISIPEITAAGPLFPEQSTPIIPIIPPVI